MMIINFKYKEEEMRVNLDNIVLWEKKEDYWINFVNINNEDILVKFSNKEKRDSGLELIDDYIKETSRRIGVINID